MKKVYIDFEATDIKVASEPKGFKQVGFMFTMGIKKKFGVKMHTQFINPLRSFEEPDTLKQAIVNVLSKWKLNIEDVQFVVWGNAIDKIMLTMAFNGEQKLSIIEQQNTFGVKRVSSNKNDSFSQATIENALSIKSVDEIDNYVSILKKTFDDKTFTGISDDLKFKEKGRLVNYFGMVYVALKMNVEYHSEKKSDSIEFLKKHVALDTLEDFLLNYNRSDVTNMIKIDTKLPRPNKLKHLIEETSDYKVMTT